MPEGHTLHRLALDLTDAFGGRTVSVSSPQGRFADSAAALDQTLMVEATAHGKHLFCEFDDDRFLHVHLGLIGKFTIGPPAPPWGEVRVRIATRDGAADLRGPQLCAVVTRSEIDAVDGRAGPGPAAARRRPRAGLAADPPGRPADCGAADGPDDPVRRRQRLPGRGAVPQPGRPAPARQQAEPAQLAGHLGRPGGADAGRGARQPDRHRPARAHPRGDGPAAAEDEHGGEVYVYRRTGLPCWVCGARVRTEVLAGRNLFWCGRCQRRG